MEHCGTLFQMSTNACILFVFSVVHEGKKEIHFATAVEIKLQKLYDHDCKGLGLYIYINSLHNQLN